MYLVYIPKNGKQVVRSIAGDETVPALIRTHDGNVGCWSCGARVLATSANAMICVECGSRMAIGNGRSVNLAITPDGAVLSKPALVGGTPQNIGVTESGDIAIFPMPGHPDFCAANHDPIGCSALELLMDAAASRAMARARA